MFPVFNFSVLLYWTMEVYVEVFTSDLLLESWFWNLDDQLSNQVFVCADVSVSGSELALGYELTSENEIGDLAQNSTMFANGLWVDHISAYMGCNGHTKVYFSFNLGVGKRK